jgi:hypothetical protein
MTTGVFLTVEQFDRVMKSLRLGRDAVDRFYYGQCDEQDAVIAELEKLKPVKPDPLAGTPDGLVG